MLDNSPTRELCHLRNPCESRKPGGEITDVGDLLSATIPEHQDMIRKSILPRAKRLPAELEPASTRRLDQFGIQGKT